MARTMVIWFCSMAALNQLLRIWTLAFVSTPMKLCRSRSIGVAGLKLGSGPSMLLILPADHGRVLKMGLEFARSVASDQMRPLVPSVGTERLLLSVLFARRLVHRPPPGSVPPTANAVFAGISRPAWREKEVICRPRGRRVTLKLRCRTPGRLLSGGRRAVQRRVWRACNP